MTLVSDIQYFAPYIFYFKLSEISDCIFDQYETFQKMSFRNRCTLLGANGTISLSIPVVGGRDQKKPVKEVRIDNRENWRARHWKTITSCYNKSPWFDFYRGELELLYRKQPGFLIDWNLDCFRWICDKMAIKASWSLSTSYLKNYDQTKFLDWRGRLMPSTINHDFAETKRYPQVFEDRSGFVPNLSILDYLFCKGNTLN